MKWNEGARKKYEWMVPENGWMKVPKKIWMNGARKWVNEGARINEMNE